ncbi:MAG: DUF370 domain-containing protein [Clostridia bacterium]|nr:DUF370 domain-containing protein [Clostridia bacterium]
MYLHIGEGRVLRKKDIVAIFELDSSTVSINTRAFLSKMQKENNVISLGYSLPKSFILTKDNKVYLSALTVKSIILP